MSRLLSLAGLAAGTLLALAPAHAAPFSVEANKTEPLRLKSPAASVVIGSPVIADVAVFDEQLLFITGKTFGTTNLMVFDAEGRLIYSNDITVVSGSTSLVRVVRGSQTETFDCAPNCRSVLNPGDSDDYFNRVYQQNDRLSRASERN